MLMAAIKYFLTILFCIFLYGESLSQELPPIQTFSPQDYKGENQNWSISKGHDGRVFVANNKGLLEFDGASWKLYPSPNETILRSVKVIDEKIYTGAYMEFGFWERDKFGLLLYTSLSKNLKIDLIEDEQVWNIETLDDWIIFQTLNRLYIYNKQDATFNIINSETTLTKLYKVNNSIYFQKINQGIFKIENGKPILVNSEIVVKENIIVNIYNSNNRLLILTQQKGFYFIDNKVLKQWSIPASNFLADVSVYNSIQLNNGGWALGTISNGLIIIDSDGQVINRINRVEGLSNNTVLSLYEDSEQNIWLGLDNGINCINMASPVSIYTDYSGEIGSIYASAIYNGNIYLGTNQGLYFREKNSISKFKFIEGTNGQVWCLDEVGGTLFCGHNNGTYIIKEDSAKLISDIQGTWNIITVPENPNLLLQGNYNGIHVLEKTGNSWVFRNKLEGFDISSRYVELLNDYIFVSHEYKGVFKLKINNDFTKILNAVKDNSVSKGLNSSLIKYNNNILYAYKEGVFKYNLETNSFVKDSVFSQLINNKNYISGKLILDKKNNTLWGFTDKDISFLAPGKLSSKLQIERVPISISARKGIVGYENITNIGNQKYLFGASNGYLIFDLGKFNHKGYTIAINTIQNSSKHNNTLVYIDKLDKDISFNNKENNIQFSYSVNEFNKYYETEYQFKLEGFYNQWSNWSKNSSEIFKNLPYGDYVFKVRARVGNGITNNEDTFVFTIEKPWYLSNLMIFVYFFGFIMFSLLMHSIYKIYYKKQRVKLLEKTNKELELKELENKQQIMVFNNEKLKQDVVSKNNELAISTMSLIRKNEFLNQIKKELSNTKNAKHINAVIKTIDKNLNNNDDWAFFEEAFNNADKDFLKKVKAKHAVLTSNDLKLCAYLRLNLSSKEIAPLLNISHRSVEVKRYRLRKKMNLKHETSLTDYILQL